MNIYLEKACESTASVLKDLHRCILPVLYSETFFKSIVADTDKLAFFIKLNTEFIGILTASVEEYKAYLMTFGLLREHRNKKIGTAALKMFEECVCKDLNIAIVSLHVQSTNLCARAFYERNGYELLMFIPDYYSNIEPNDAYYMEKHV